MTPRYQLSNHQLSSCNILGRNHSIQEAVLTGRPAVRGLGWILRLHSTSTLLSDNWNGNCSPVACCDLGTLACYRQSCNPISQVSGVGNRKSLCVRRQAAATLFASDVRFGRRGIRHHPSRSQAWSGSSNMQIAPLTLAWLYRTDKTTTCCQIAPSSLP